jgi:hypothetical protein
VPRKAAGTANPANPEKLASLDLGNLADLNLPPGQAAQRAQSQIVSGGTRAACCTALPPSRALRDGFAKFSARKRAIPARQQIPWARATNAQQLLHWASATHARQHASWESATNAQQHASWIAPPARRSMYLG